MRYPTREYQRDRSSLPFGRSADCVNARARMAVWAGRALRGRMRHL